MGGVCYANGCHEQVTKLHTLTCGKTGWGTITHNRILHRAVARELRDARVPISIEDSTPFTQSRQGASEHPLRMDIVTAPGSLFLGNNSLRTKSILIDLTITHPATNTRLARHAHRLPGSAVDDAATAKRRKYLGTFPATSYHLLPLAMSVYGEIGADGHDLIRAIAEAKVHARGLPETPEDYKVQVGAHTSAIRRRLSCALSQALSSRTRARLCGQGIYTLGPIAAPLNHTAQQTTPPAPRRGASSHTPGTTQQADRELPTRTPGETATGAPAPSESCRVEQA